MEIPISVQLYSVREEAKKDFISVLKSIAGFGYAGVEFAGFHGLAPKELRRVVDDLGMKVSSNHGAFPSDQNVKEIVETAHALGYKWHVSGMGPDQFVTEDLCKKSAAAFQKAAQLLKREGLGFAVHNHWWEFDKEFGGKTPQQILMAGAPDLYAQIDTYWVTVAGKDPASIIKDLGKRVPLLHIKDGPLDCEKAMTAVGAGKMDWKRVMSAVDEKTIEWMIVELDRCDTDMMQAVDASLKYMVKQGMGVTTHAPKTAPIQGFPL